MDSQSDFEQTVRLSPLEHVRKRPGMYVGGTDSRALHHLAYEVLDHMAEEAFVGRCNHIWIELLANHEITIRDDSHGIPVDLYKNTSVTKLEAIMQEFGFFKSEFEPTVYRVTGGLHGVGLSVVNALSAEMKIENKRDGFLWEQTYQQGIPQTPVSKVKLETENDTGTTFTFKPDYSIFEAVDFDLQKLEKRAQELAYQISDLEVSIRDLRVEPPYHRQFHYPDGLKMLVTELNAGSKPLHEPIHVSENMMIHRNDKPDIVVGIEFAFQFSEGDLSHLYGYANTVETLSGGTHLAALRSALLSCFNEYLETYHFEDAEPFTWNEIASGLSAAISIRLPQPSFVSPTKVQLANPEIYGPVAGLVFRLFYPYSHTLEMKPIVEHYLSRRKRRKSNLSQY
jgi:DNA gyrase subunit B